MRSPNSGRKSCSWIASVAPRESIRRGGKEREMAPIAMERELVQRKDAASSFLEGGIDSYRREDFGSACFYLDLAGRLYGELGDTWNQKVTRGWYASARRHLKTW